MTEEQIIERALKVVRDYLTTIRISGVFDTDRCMQGFVIPEMKKLYREQMGLPKATKLHGRELQEQDLFLAHFDERLLEGIASLRQKYLRDRKVQDINAITAKSIITEAFEKAGMSATVIPQRYRARVLVSIVKGRELRFYVRYKDLGNENLIDEIITTVNTIKDGLTRLGTGACVKIVG